MIDKQAVTALFEKYISKLRITPAWDIRLEWVENAADFLLAVMPIMFVPAASSLMTKWELIKDDVAGLLITSVVSTAIVMAVSGLVTQFVIRRRKKGEKQASADATPKGGSRA